MKRVTNPVLRRLTEVAALPDLPSARYTLQNVLGAGGMGVVYAAHDESLDRDVAVKVLHEEGDAALAERLRHEARVLARLEHPGVVPVHDVGLLPDGRLFYVMKRVRGQTLTAWLQTVSDRDRRLGTFERICETVAFAHEQGVVHRDLKPDNVMVGAFGEVLVLDWGVARVLAENVNPSLRAPLAVLAGQTLTGSRVGTPGFMPPEQIRGEPADRRADVYALGAILFQLLFDRPFAADGDADAASQLQRRRDLPKRLRAICARTLARAPGDRYPDANALADEIARFRAGQPVRAYHETLIDRVERVFTLYRTPILLVVAYLIMRVLIELIAALRS
jgi:serine/threonine protein kinase